MGKKSRGKKHKKDRVRMTPDEVIAQGPLRIARYGRHIIFSNTSTPEQHATFLERCKDVNRQVLTDLERELAVLQGLVRRYDPIELMQMAAYMLLPLFLKYHIESEFKGEESYFLPAVEYLQYLIARTEPNTDGKIPSEVEWHELWAQALKVLKLTQSHLMVRGTITIPPSEIDQLRFILDGRRLAIRVKRYSLFFADHLRSSLTPYEQQIKEIYGIGIQDIVEGLNKIGEYQRTGVLDRSRDVKDMIIDLMDKLRSKGYAVDPDASPEEMNRTQTVMKTGEFKEMYEITQEQARLTYTSAIFEITDLTSLPKPFLSLLSVKPGESKLNTLTGPAPDYDDLSPLSTSVLHYKPFLEVNGKFYTFYHSGFEDHIADIIETDLFNRRPTQVSEMAKKRSDRLESDSKELLSTILRPEFAHQNIYYPNPDDAGNLTELDLLLVVDDVLFLVEAKAGGFSASASRGAPKSMEQEFSDLIIEGQRQSERAAKYIKSADEVAFYDHTGKVEVVRIRHSHFRKVFRIIITREDLGWVGAKIAILSVLDPSLSMSYPWHVSIDDLRIIAELFNNDEIRFIHYLETRLLVSAESALEQHDEIEHVGLYNKLNDYREMPAEGMNRLSYDASFMREIDLYFMAKVAGESLPLPEQKMPNKMREFIAALRISHLPHRCEFGSRILSMGAAGREQLKGVLDVLDAGRIMGRHRTFRMPFTELKIGLSITYIGDLHWVDELHNSAAQMERGQCDRWLIVQLGNTSPYEITRIEVIKTGMFSDVELTEARSRLERKTQKEIEAYKPGPNDKCPCGSGLKYKKCHGK